eukprot:737002_1
MLGAEDLECEVVKIATRKSQLAMWQAKTVHGLLTGLYPEESFEIVGMTTLGDQNLSQPLSSFSDKGVFTKELDVALLQSSVQLAVHSMKDLPTVLPEGLTVGAVLERGSVEDALVVRKGLEVKSIAELPPGSKVGTSSVRRRAMLARNYAHLQCLDVRGNLNTRLRKLDEGQYDALLLARAGLERLEWNDRITQVLDFHDFPHAVAQGALAVVCREDDEKTLKLLEKLVHEDSFFRCCAERGLLKTLEGGCKVPIAVWTNLEDGVLEIYGCVVSPDGSQFVESSLKESVKNSENAADLGSRLAKVLIEMGGDKILDLVRETAV